MKKGRKNSAVDRKRPAKVAAGESTDRVPVKGPHPGELVRGPGDVQNTQLVNDDGSVRAVHAVASSDFAFHFNRGTLALSQRETAERRTQATSLRSMIVFVAREPEKSSPSSKPPFADLPSATIDVSWGFPQWPRFGGTPGPHGTLNEVFAGTLSSYTVDPQHWAGEVIKNGAPVFLDVAAELLEREQDLSTHAGSTLQFIGDLFSKNIRRRILRRTLEETGWNLSYAAEILRFRAGSKVLEVIRELGLEAEYLAKKQAGTSVRRGEKPLPKTRKR